MSDAGFQNWFEWHQHVNQGGDEAFNIIPRRESGKGFTKAKNRALIVKVEGLLDIIFRKLLFDPSNPTAEFTYEGCLNHVKKIDKNLGP